MRQVRTLPALLDDWELVFGRYPGAPAPAGVLAWGLKSSAEVARRFAARRGLPLLRVEDGFLRSVSPGRKVAPLSLVVDDLGIYYDASRESRLERLIAAPRDEAQRERARRLCEVWCEGRLSKYNHAREGAAPVAGPFVLVVDQTFGDASIRHGAADAASFARMLEAALDEHPGLPVVLKVHPDVIAGSKRGHFASLTSGQAARVTLLASDLHPPSLLARAEAVYAVSSQMGFEALMWGRPVRVFGLPFYAGWGLTEDELAPPPRRRAVPLENLVHAALVDYARYIDPETLQRCEPERLMAWMALQRRMRERFPAQVYAFGFSHWKRPIVRAFFSGSQVQFVEQPQQVPPDATLAVWGRRELPGREGDAAAAAPRMVRLEDGFLRSVGLGAELVAPLSWVMDRSGLYYDATAASDLETLLARTEFDAALLERARLLRQRIVAGGITKYNVGSRPWQRPAGVARVVLVVGQVESDASLAFGAPALRRNMDLLRTVRELVGDAHLVYKPHPDVVAQLRAAGDGEGQAAQWCDEVAADVPMDRLLAAVDEVHVLTSLAGFEALLRGRKVVTHGLPFYAGWGLTEDRLSTPRRTRSLTLDALVAATLILYPTYVSRTTGHFTTPERALTELQEWKARGMTSRPLWRRLLRWFYRLRPA